MNIYPFNFSNPISVECDWPAFYYNNILDEGVFQSLQQDFEEIDWRQMEILDREQQTTRGGSTESVWCSLQHAHVIYEYFSQPEVTSFIENTADVDLSNCHTRINFKYDTPSHKLQGQHRDKGLAVLTFQIFLQDENYPDGGTVLHSRSGDFEIPMLRNCGGFFKNTADSWHSVKRRGYHRKSILVRYTKNNS
jgi:hypothetical protein